MFTEEILRKNQWHLICRSRPRDMSYSINPPTPKNDNLNRIASKTLIYLLIPLIPLVKSRGT